MPLNVHFICHPKIWFLSRRPAALPWSRHACSSWLLSWSATWLCVERRASPMRMTRTEWPSTTSFYREQRVYCCDPFWRRCRTRRVEAVRKNVLTCFKCLWNQYLYFNCLKLLNSDKNLCILCMKMANVLLPIWHNECASLRTAKTMRGETSKEWSDTKSRLVGALNKLNCGFHFLQRDLLLKWNG